MRDPREQGPGAPPQALWMPHDDGTWRASTWAVGPWDPGALHGGPVAALLARAIEAEPADAPMHVADFHLYLLRPVGLGPHRIRTDVERPGRKVRIVVAELVGDDERVVARARAVLIRLLPPEANTELQRLAAQRPNIDPAEVVRAPRAGLAPPSFLPDEQPSFHNRAVEHDFVEGHLEVSGPARDWIRLLIDVVPGESPSPLQRTVAAADFGNGVSASLDFSRYSFVNPDLTVTLHRPAVGEWICVDARTRLGPPGVATAEANLFDSEGPIGRSIQTLMVEPR